MYIDERSSVGTIASTLILPMLRAHRYTQVLLEEYDDRSYALRGNASQDAPHPLSNVAQTCAQALTLSTSCARLTESTVCAICDAERHGRHAHAERWARSVLRQTCV